MSGVETKQSQNLAGNKRRSLSGQGGLLNRMFASSGGNGRESNSNAVAVDGGQTDGLPASPITATPLSASNPIGPVEENKDETSSDVRSPTKGSESAQSLEKKRRSSGVGRARDLFSSAKQSLRDMGTSSPEHRNPGGSPQTPMQKLGKLDPALGVPQGAHNNSAGESAPGPRSTFRVGVTEDKNKKCRRTMEDTHAFLYNFLSTPAPVLTSGASSKARSSLETGVAMSETSSQGVVETDNGYFAIFDGHAGSFAADWCGKKVHLLLEDVIRKHPNSPIPELLDMTFTSVDQQLEKLPLKNSGCTAALAVLRWEDRIPNSQSATGSTAIAPAAAAAVKSDGGYTHTAPEFSDVGATEVKLRQAATRQRVLYTANVGDARIVLCRNGKALRLSYDHKGSDENEGKRIAGAGGLILNNRVNGVLALWDVCSDQEAVDLIRITQDPQYASRQLVEHALARFSTDNLSCMVVRFDSKAVQQTVAHEVEPIGVDGDPATKHGGVSEAEAIVMEQKAKLDQTGEKMDRIPSDAELMGEHREMGPELNAEALDRARKDKDVLGHGPNQ
ncbi:hypothetical protein B0A54_06283 [Friedmanniomyces endolithicus]|uniref:PPM-type phosphatase domain-containing protein n=1 Tax=Friedmanniomyces endolithicus TaxID=329885 RepID=A0A4U0UYR9_9PEZI|nr:hypothetical protein B0A54_06283 [Friedmanniomyces endolithicus]